MSGYGKNVAPFTAQIPNAKRDYLDRRGDRLNWSRSKVVAEIINFWFAKGAPSLSEIDAPSIALAIPPDAAESSRPYWVEIVPFVEAPSHPGIKKTAEETLKKLKQTEQEKKKRSNRDGRKGPDTPGEPPEGRKG